MCAPEPRRSLSREKQYWLAMGDNDNAVPAVPAWDIEADSITIQVDGADRPTGGAPITPLRDPRSTLDMVMNDPNTD